MLIKLIEIAQLEFLSKAFQAPSETTRVEDLELSEVESTQPLSAQEHRHLLAFGMSPMGTLRPQALVIYETYMTKS